MQVATQNLELIKIIFYSRRGQLISLSKTFSAFKMISQIIFTVKDLSYMKIIISTYLEMMRKKICSGSSSNLRITSWLRWSVELAMKTKIWIEEGLQILIATMKLKTKTKKIMQMIIEMDFKIASTHLCNFQCLSFQIWVVVKMIKTMGQKMRNLML